MTWGPDARDHQPRVLIVDDERKNRQLLEEMLAPESFLTMSVGSGEEALAIIAGQPPDLVLLDVMMPVTRIERGLPFVQKPFTSAEFARHVREALDR